MSLDPILLSRIQFGFTVSFHILFPTLTVGLSLFLAIMEGLWLRTGDPLYQAICQFWAKVFALTFGMGVVSGVVLGYELGTNFGPFIQVAGGVIGSLFVYEVLAAFFVEAGFLGVMLFGWNKVSPRMHFTATCIVALSTSISALAILSANSWMQTPAGFHLEGGQYVVDSWWAVIFNPSYPLRALHMMLASYLTSCFVVAGVSGWHLLKGRHTVLSQKCFSFALITAFWLALLQIIVGDRVGVNVYRYQPLKTAAVEGLWETQKGAPALLFAIPDSKHETNHYALGIPKVASLTNTHHWDGELIGLKSALPQDRPPVSIPFWMFRVMFGIGILMFGTTLLGLLLRGRGQLFQRRWFMQLCLLISPLGFLGTLAGWMVAESGRQPWIVYGWMRTTEGAAKLSAHQVATSLSLFVMVYGIVFGFYLYYLFRVIRTGPSPIKLKGTIEEMPFKYLAPEADIATIPPKGIS